MLVAHNGFAFHYQMLISEANRYGISELMEGIFEKYNILFSDSIVHVHEVKKNFNLHDMSTAIETGWYRGRWMEWLGHSPGATLGFLKGWEALCSRLKKAIALLQLKDETGRLISMTRGMSLDDLFGKHFPEGMGFNWFMKQGMHYAHLNSFTMRV